MAGLSTDATSIRIPTWTPASSSPSTSSLISQSVSSTKLWHLRRDDRYPAAYRIDDGPLQTAEARVIDARIVVFAPPDGTTLGALVDASALVAAVAGVTFRFELHDIRPALEALVNCTTRNVTQTAQGVPETRSERAESAPSTDPPQRHGTANAPLRISGDVGPNEFRAGSWVGMFYPESGPSGICAVTAVFDRERSLIFTLDRQGRFTFAVQASEWRLSKGESHPLSFRLDNQPHATRATAAFPDTLKADPADTRLLLFDFRNASSLSVETLGQRFDFQLVGIAAGIDALMNCVKEHVGAATAGKADRDAPRTGGNPPAPGRRSKNTPDDAPGGSNPFVAPEDRTRPESPDNGGSNPFAPRAPSGMAAASDAIAAARDFVERLLVEAGLTDYKILTGAEVPPGDRALDVVVRIGGQTATLSLVDARRYHSVAEASAAIVKDASLICDQGFTSTIATRSLRDGRPAAQMRASCTRPRPFHAAYTVVPVTEAGYYRLSLTSFGDPAELEAIQARIGSALARIVPEG